MSNRFILVQLILYVLLVCCNSGPQSSINPVTLKDFKESKIFAIQMENAELYRRLIKDSLDFQVNIALADYSYLNPSRFDRIEKKEIKVENVNHFLIADTIFVGLMKKYSINKSQFLKTTFKYE